ncbi:hypothetical protein CROQUDRAFT_723609 [Cronartium quercuum f. sp. fusiforme G11]|uniref:Secreted protein n=1 Tax=Cronartium quercuum f. sp. fusiforme G11 TaxID=708437 RepID=A0A9P6NE77_9BASI|nr:hypothetical protein CROQUDRAFT_723609 [Cronartium quercuum f. sp. fusiforme G11]
MCHILKPTSQLAFFFLSFIAMVTYTLGHHKHKYQGLVVSCRSGWNSTHTNNSNITGYQCTDSGVIYDCPICHDYLVGKNCYKKLGEDNFDSQPSGNMECTTSYDRTAYEEGGGVITCEMCQQVRFSSTP